MKILKSIFIFILALSVFSSFSVSAQRYNNSDVVANRSIIIEFVSEELCPNGTDRKTINECASNVLDIYNDRYPENSEIIYSIIKDISNRQTFIDAFSADGKVAFQIIEDSLRDALEPDISTYTTENGRRYVNVQLVNQLCYDPVTKKPIFTFCGPAAALQALLGYGKIENTPVNRSSSMIYSIGKEMGSNASGTYISSITNYMKKYFKHPTWTYKTKAFTKYTYDKALGMVSKSLMYGCAPIIRIPDTKVLKYYNGASFTHYVTISEIDFNNNTVTLVDPHYDSRYNGIHAISMSEFNNLVNYDGWMSVCTFVPDGEYIYTMN